MHSQLWLLRGSWGAEPGFIKPIPALRVQTQIESHGSSRTRTPLLASTFPLPPPPRQTAPAWLQSTRTMPHPTRLTVNLVSASPFTHQNSRQNSPRLTESTIFRQAAPRPPSSNRSRAICENHQNPRISKRSRGHQPVRHHRPASHRVSNSPSPPYQRKSQVKSVTYKLLIRVHIAGSPRFHTPFQSQNVSWSTPHHTRNRRHLCCPQMFHCVPRHSEIPSKPNSHRQPAAFEGWSPIAIFGAARANTDRSDR